MSTDAAKLKQATAHLKNAEKAMKSGIFSKSHPEDAAPLYAKAAVIFEEAEHNAEAKDCYYKAGDAYDQAGLTLKSAEMFAKAAQLAFILTSYDEIVTYLEEAKIRYGEGNQLRTAIRAYREMAERLREANPELSMQLYDIALTIVEDEDQYHWEKDSFVDRALLSYELKDIPGAVQAFERAKKAYLHLKHYDNAAHSVVAAIAIEMQAGDIVAASNIFNAAMQEDFFIQTDDFSMIDYILRGVKNHDGDLIELGQRNVILQFLKPEIQRILLSFSAPKAEPTEPSRPSAQPVAAPEPHEEEEEDSQEEVSQEEEENADWLL